MELPRRAFLHLAAGAAALPALSGAAPGGAAGRPGGGAGETDKWGKVIREANIKLE